MKKEVQWKDCSVVDCPKYMVSTAGDLFNSNTNQKMNPGVSRTGYKMVCIRDEQNNRHVFNLGRLVLMVFSPHPLMFDKGMIECDHIDGDKSNNNIENLRWLTRDDNKKLRYLKNKRKYHKRGVALVKYELNENLDLIPSKVYVYARQSDTPLPYSVINTLLRYEHYSKKYMCSAFYLDMYKDQEHWPEELKNLPVSYETERTTRDRKIACYDENGVQLKVYRTITSTEKDGFNFQKAYRAARDGKPYMNLDWKFID